jgi:hypothetical protein
MGNPVKRRRALNKAQNASIRPFSKLLKFMRDIVPLPELTNFSFQFERAIIQRKPAARISFEFGGHLSFHNPPQTH